MAAAVSAAAPPCRPANTGGSRQRDPIFDTDSTTAERRGAGARGRAGGAQSQARYEQATGAPGADMRAAAVAEGSSGAAAAEAAQARSASAAAGGHGRARRAACAVRKREAAVSRGAQRGGRRRRRRQPPAESCARTGGVTGGDPSDMGAAVALRALQAAQVAVAAARHGHRQDARGAAQRSRSSDGAGACGTRPRQRRAAAACGAVPRHEHAQQGGGVYIGTNTNAKTRAGSSRRQTRRIRTLQVDCRQQPAVRPQGRSGNCVQEGLCAPLRDCTTPDCNSRINVILWYWLVGLRIVSGP